MHVRCPYCRQSFNLSRDYMIDVVVRSLETKQKYQAVECINCRKTIKVPIAQMRRLVPDAALAQDEEKA